MQQENPLNPDFGKPFVFFRPSGGAEVHFWQSASDAVLLTAHAALRQNEGWVVAPFRFFGDGKLWYFPADVQQTFPPEALRRVSLPAQTAGLPPLPAQADTPQADFEAWVSRAVDDMEQGRFQKTALSKVRNVNLPAGFDWAVWFAQACARFPNAWVFFVHIPGVFTWAGATPELLLSADGGQVRSVSLAGTLHPDSTADWTAKEAEEQRFVTDYIRDIFQRSGFADVAVQGPEILSIGKLRHLKTTFSAPYTASGTDGLAELVARLHPTPAVGGMPRAEGLDFLLRHETHPRHWYSGFLGTVSPGGRLAWYVNLRSMAVYRGAAVLYAGAGITAQSLPHAEWMETENKLAMNLDVLKLA